MAKFALQRLSKQGAIASPAGGFYVIVPAEYRPLRCLPADQFIPALMKEPRLPYYVGLLTAAQYHGAAHQRPQEFQVLLVRPRRPIECGKVRVAFIVRKRLRDVAVQELNTQRGVVRVSTPEATALDLPDYHRHAGRFDQVAHGAGGVGDHLDPDKRAAKAGPLKGFALKSPIRSDLLGSDLITCADRKRSDRA